MSSSSTRARVAAVVSGIGAVAATMLLAPGAASADVAPGSVAVQPGLNIRIGAADYGTTCPYQVTALESKNGEKVNFQSREHPAPSPTVWSPIGTATATTDNDTVSATWTPATTGSFVVNANSNGKGVSAAPVTVGNGYNLFGLACIVY